MIKKLINFIKGEEIFKQSIILSLAGIFLSLASFFYHFFTGRFLGPEEYAIIASAMAIIYILQVPINTIQISLTNFVSKFNAKKQYGKIKNLFVRSLKRLSIYGAVVSIAYLAFCFFLADYLKIPYSTLAILALCVFMVFVLPIGRGVLQGMQKFLSLGINLSVEGLGKIGFCVLLVLLGFKSKGAIFAIALSFVLGFVVLMLQLYKLHKYKTKQPIDTKQVYKYSLPVFVSLTALMFLFSIDVLMVKHYFPSLLAGHYAAASLLGKIIYFATTSVVWVMFPMVVEHKTKKKAHFHLLNKALIFVFGVGIFVTFFYALIPKYVIWLLFGKSYLDISNLLWVFALLFLFYSANYTVALYLLSLERYWFSLLLIAACFLEVIGIMIFHAAFVRILSIVTSLFLILFLILYFMARSINGKEPKWS